MKRQKLWSIALGVWSALFCGLMTHPVWAQFGQGTYEFGSLPQSWQMNPAHSPNARVFLALPGITGRFYAPAFSLSDVLLPVNNQQSRLDFKSVFESKAGRAMDFSLSTQAEILQLGFSPNQNSYLGLGSGVVLQTNLQLPVDLLRLVQNGNAGAYFRENNLNMSQMGVSALAYLQHHIAFSRDVGAKWRVGGRIKYLQGMFALDSRESKFILHASTDSIRLESNTLILTAGIPALLNDSGGLASNLNIRMADLIQTNRGSGLGYDLGASFAPSEKLQFSMSVIDLGGITWKQDLHTYAGGPYTYSFYGVNYTLNIDSLNNTAEQLQSATDSLLRQFKVKETAAKSFRSSLRTGFHLAASFKASRRLQCGGIVSGMSTHSAIRTAFTSYLQWNPSRFFQLRTS